jgi:hypothetical protein
LEYRDTTQHHPDAEAVMELVRGVLIAIARLAECTPASAGEIPKWSLIVQNMAEIMRNLYQFLKGKQLYSALYGEYTEVLHDFTAVLKESGDKGETAKITTTEHPSNEEFREQRRRKRKPSDDANKITKKPATSPTGVNDPQLRSKDEVLTHNFFAPLRSTEMEADHGDDADDSTEGQVQQAPPCQRGRALYIVLTSRINLIQLQRKLRDLLKGNFEFYSTRNRTTVVTKGMADFQPSAFTSRAITSHTSPSIPNPRSL